MAVSGAVTESSGSSSRSSAETSILLLPTEVAISGSRFSITEHYQ